MHVSLPFLCSVRACVHARRRWGSLSTGNTSKLQTRVRGSHATLQVSLEQEAKGALEREKALAERALAAEKQLVEAMRMEAAAADEALQAERAAKYAADAEAAELQRMLEEVGGQAGEGFGLGWGKGYSAWAGWVFTLIRECQPAKGAAQVHRQAGIRCCHNPAHCLLLILFETPLSPNCR